jgi:tRNA nucleotidyltransferase/poly(A) polymerase
MNTLQALKRLQNETKAEVFLVGGFVRNYIRNKKSNNLSVVIRKVDKKIIIDFLEKYGKCIAVKSDDIYTQKTMLFRASGDNREAQISLPRRGSQAHIIDKNNTLRQDAKCRDFKINALYLPINFTSKKDVIDPRGGLINIKLRTIFYTTSYFCSGSPIRVLRAISLAAETGYKLSNSLKKSIKEEKYRVSWANKDDIRKELNKILLSDKPSTYLSMMQSIEMLVYVMPELSRCAGVKQDPRYHKYDVFTHNILTCDNIEPDIVLRLAAVLHDVGKPDSRKIIKGRVTFHKHEMASVKRANTFLSRLLYDGKIKENVLSLIRMHMYHYTREFTDAAVRRFIKRAGIDEKSVKNLKELPLFKLRSAERLGNGLKKEPVTPKQISFEKRIKKVFESGDYKPEIVIDINKRIIIKAFDIPPGKEVDNILHYLTERVKHNKKLNNRIDLIQITLQYIKNKRYHSKVL